MKRWIYIGSICIFALIFLISSFLLIRYLNESRKQQSQFDELLRQVEQSTVPQQDPEVTSEEYDPYVTVTHPVTGEQLSILRQYAQLFQQNPHMAGWMHIPGTKINYPVMQTPEQPNFYIDHNFSREASSHGCLYAQENCDLSVSDNVIIYGHNMRDGSMFAALQDYKTERFWQEHKTILFDTLQERRTYEILAVFYTTATEGSGFAYHEFTDTEDEVSFASFVRTCKNLSIYDTGVDAVFGDRLITLSTCDYAQANGRLVVVAKCSDNS